MRGDRHGEAAAAASAFDPQELALARRFRGMRKNELARAVGVTPAALSQYELGHSRPSPAVLAKLAFALGVPVKFLVQGHAVPVTPTAAHFRSLRATTHLERDQAIAFGQLAWRLTTGIERYLELPACRLPQLTLPADPADGITVAAGQARTMMGIASGPVPHVTRLLEAHGTVVMQLSPMTLRVDAFSHWYDGRPFVLLNPAKPDKARARFDAAHELGHLVLHHDAEPGNRIVENQAHDFAAEFLAPCDEIADELPRRLAWDVLHQLKRRWGISLKALLYRARKLGVIGESAYRTGMITLAQWGDPEPGDLGPRESPVLLGSAMQLLADAGISPDTLAYDVGMAPETVAEILQAAQSPRPRLELNLA